MIDLVPMPEKRGFPRKKIEAKVTLVFDGLKISAVVMDISVKGLLLKCDQPLEVGKSIKMNLLEHEEISSCILEGQIVRCNRVKEDNFVVAFSLVKPDDKFMMDALAYIHQYQD